MDKRDAYQSPLTLRYASQEMSRLFSQNHKFSTWRKLWIALAEAEMELGLPIAREQIDQMRAHVTDINYDVAIAREKEVRHDVMAHVYAYGQQAPLAAPIIHLGATSCYVCDNTDILILREGLALLRGKLLSVIAALSAFARQYAALPTLGYTHFQPAQPVTVGKRAALWMQDFVMDIENLDDFLGRLKMLGCRGTTGTQASFMELFEGDEAKTKQLDENIARKMGFDGIYPVSGQTYTRKIDDNCLHVLSGIAQSAMKFAGDLRLLQHEKEIEEPYESGQIGSSAMAYKRNPMRAERVASLARYVMSLSLNTALTAGTQWLERTLDDSANRRLTLAEAFLCADGILNTCRNVASGLVVHESMIAANLLRELPFMATENILMDAVKRGGDRQELHERIRRHSADAGRMVKDEGKPNDLLDRIAQDPAFGLSKADLSGILRPENYTGRAEGQTLDFLRDIETRYLAGQELPPDCAIDV